MRVLWFTTEATRYSHLSVACYGSSGLVDALHDALLEGDKPIELGMAFIYGYKAPKEKRGKITYYPMYRKSRNLLQKLAYYWYNYKRKPFEMPRQEMLDIIEDFKPDVIQIFGVESPFAGLLGHTEIPVIIHLQGFLNPTYNAFYPQGVNRLSFLWKTFSVNEWIIHNGQNFIADEMRALQNNERSLFKRMDYATGRTGWDAQIIELMAPGAQYFHVGEMMREEFVKAGPWKLPSMEKLVFVSTLSKTVYKGLDVILKTAKLLREYSGIDFEWRIVGIDEKTNFVRFFEKQYNINSKEVNVKYLGICDAGQICNNLLQSHVYIHPSYIDNSPNSLCEAQYVGVPVIGTFVGGIPSLITHEKTGLLVPANAPFELCYWIKSLHQNPDKLVELGKTGRSVAIERHSKEKIVSDLLNVYHSVTEK
ncbi:MAG: glycosyltransferase [Bacteroidales bacterium]|jgi:glycosyltransferase involved in cell wall biosynthesis|nr:glycosyltransferase [Bacteroidales bacterium]